MWSIRVLSGHQAGQIYDLKLGKNIFGRGGESDFKVQSLGISKEHCEIHVYREKILIVDLKSSNGTFVNGIKIQNSILKVGDKISLFDVILDIIPMSEIRIKKMNKAEIASTGHSPSLAVQAQGSTVPSEVAQNWNNSMNYPQGVQGGNAAMQMSYQQEATPYREGLQGLSHNLESKAQVAQSTFYEKVENYIENVVMPGIYKLGIIFSFKQILLAFVTLFVLLVTILSSFPLISIIKESNLKEATKLVKSIARTLAKNNEQALLAGQFDNLSVEEALKTEGIKEAFIIQQSDGQIVAPSEKAGRDNSNPLFLIARKEARSAFLKINANMIGASFPIAVYDPLSGDAIPKYHAVVTYDIDTLNVDEGLIISLFAENLMIASVLGAILYFLFARLIEFPIKTLNLQINKALLEKSDRTEVSFDYPAFQHLVSNVNTILNRAWSGEGAVDSAPTLQQNRDSEFSNLVEMISHPAIVVDAEQRVIALNFNFEQLAQMNRDEVLNQTYKHITDSSLVQNMDSLISKATLAPYEKHGDKIPFAQFECEILCQAFLSPEAQPQYFLITLMQLSTNE